MKTLTDMLEDRAEYPGGGIPVEDAKRMFQRWLKEVSLGDILDKSLLVDNARHDFILLVDEP